ncbi:MAG TPA: S41 family peptidase [Candidatus Acidoferrales bacterium]|nr:S41 family peptidase [Candidatus Acidoferrales bacterium]
MSLDIATREKIYSRVCDLVTRKHFDPGMSGANWEELSKSRKDKILGSSSDEVFEKQMQELLNELKTSHTGFRHSKSPNIPGRHAIAATFMRCDFDGEKRWMFQDVHEGGPAHTAGLRPGDILLQVRNRELKPPEPPIFPVGDDSQYAVQKPDGKRIVGQLHVPSPRSKSHPVIVPKAVLCSQLPDGVGWLKVTMFPGAVGIDLAHMFDTAISHLKDSTRLIVDLRGNTGGGIGGLRLMSYLTPGKKEVGYSLTRARKEKGYAREKLPRFGRIPSHKATLLWLALRYGFIDKSILVVTEGLGPQRFHGRVIILVNEHTASAGEMLAAFAEENSLATIVGAKTAGRLLSGTTFRAGEGYIVGLPVAAYLTWQGRLIEGKGVTPGVPVELRPEQLLAGEDPQLQRALELARGA